MADETVPPQEDAIRRVLPRGRNALDRETVAASQQARVLEAMQELSVEVGFGNVRVADLIARAGVAKPTFYAHYASKLACFVALIDLLFNQMVASIAGALDPDGTPEERIEQGIGALVDFAVEDPARARVIIVEGPGAGSEAVEKLDESFAILANLYVAFREETRKANPEIPPMSLVRARAIVGAIYEPIAAALRAGEGLDDPELRSELIHVVKLIATSD